MDCGGGAGDDTRRFCVNCLDLHWREKREKAIGGSITYLSEEDCD